MTALAGIRAGRGLLVSEAAREAGLSRTTLAEWESGDHDPTLSNLGTYLESLGLRLTLTAVDAGDDAGEQLPYGDLVIAPGEKACNGCGQIRAVREFHVDRSRRDGRVSTCKHCRRDRRELRLRVVAA